MSDYRTWWNDGTINPVQLELSGILAWDIDGLDWDYFNDSLDVVLEQLWAEMEGLA